MLLEQRRPWRPRAHRPGHPRDRTVRQGGPGGPVDVDRGLLAGRTGAVLLVDKGYRDAATEAILAERGVRLLRPAFKGEAPRPGQGVRSLVAYDH